MSSVQTEINFHSLHKAPSYAEIHLSDTLHTKSYQVDTYSKMMIAVESSGVACEIYNGNGN